RLDLRVQVEVPADQPRGAGPAAPATGGLAGRGHDGRVVREPEVIVREKEQSRPAIDDDLGGRTALERTQRAAQPCCFEAPQLRRELTVQCVHRPVMAVDPRLVNLTPTYGWPWS